LSFLDPFLKQIRYAVGVAGYLGQPIGLEEARRITEQQLSMRNDRFLEMLEQAVYGNPGSPYLKLLRHAGFELPRLRRMVRENGIEQTLEALYDAGVYVTQEELKGRVPVRRDGIGFPVTQADFDNPRTRNGELEMRTSGTTGEATRIRGVFDNLTERMAASVAIGWTPSSHSRPIAFWLDSLARVVRESKNGVPPAKFFCTVPFRWDGAGFQMLGAYVASRLARCPTPWPEFVPRDQAIKVARWLASMRALGTPAIVHCHASPATRVCLAANQAGLDISGTTFMSGGEPLTAGKAEVIESAGANFWPGYNMIELGWPVGAGCLTPKASDDLHLITTGFAMIHRARPTSTGEPASALIYTTLLPMAPKILLNWDSGDYATVEVRDCGCELNDMGFKTHISGVHSYNKLTSEGVTFSGSRLYELVEEVLPARFGGAVGDYQLVEEEEAGLPRVRIVVSPRVGIIDEGAVIAAVMDGLERSHAGAGGKEMTEQWRQGDTLQVVRREPEQTRTMKVLPLRVRPRAAEEPVRAGADD
jgi:hypothetical protein